MMNLYEFEMRGCQIAQGFSFWAHPELVSTSNKTATLQTEHRHSCIIMGFSYQNSSIR